MSVLHANLTAYDAVCYLQPLIAVDRIASVAISACGGLALEEWSFCFEWVAFGQAPLKWAIGPGGVGGGPLSGEA